MFFRVLENIVFEHRIARITSSKNRENKRRRIDRFILLMERKGNLNILSIDKKLSRDKEVFKGGGYNL